MVPTHQAKKTFTTRPDVGRVSVLPVSETAYTREHAKISMKLWDRSRQINVYVLKTYLGFEEQPILLYHADGLLLFGIGGKRETTGARHTSFCTTENAPRLASPMDLPSGCGGCKTQGMWDNGEPLEPLALDELKSRIV